MPGRKIYEDYVSGFLIETYDLRIKLNFVIRINERILCKKKIMNFKSSIRFLSPPSISIL